MSLPVGAIRLEPGIPDSGVLADTDRITADTTAWTADNMSFVADYLGNVRPREVVFDSQPFRPPFGAQVYLAGTGKRGPEDIELVFEITHDSGITEASPLVGDLLDRLRNASAIHTHLGTFIPDGLLAYVRTPIVAGYRVQATMGMKLGLEPDGLGVLRFISGPVWSLR